MTHANKGSALLKRLLPCLGAIAIALLVAAPAIASGQARALSDAVLDQMQAGEFQAVHDGLAPDMQAAVSVQALAQGWTGLQQQFGPLQSRGEPRLLTRAVTTLVVTPLHFEHATWNANLAFDDQERTISLLLQPAPAAAPPPADDAGYAEHDFSVGQGDAALPGTLAMPDGQGPFPAVVLVHGSGAQDRDETIGPNRPFLDIARGLADQGIAALRYDKRTLVHQAAAAADPDFGVDDETTSDAVVAVAALRATPGIDPERVYVFGHSLGAMMAPRIVQRAEGAAGAILFAAPARKLLDVVPGQIAYMGEMQGADPAQTQAVLDRMADATARLRAGDDVPAAETPLGLPAAYWRSTEAVDPVAEARALAQPLLVLHGGRDVQVIDTDWQMWREAFSDDPRVELKRYPELGHLGIAADADDPLASYQQAGKVEQALIDDVANWIRAR